MTLPYSSSGCMHVLKISMIESVSKEERDFLPSHMTHHVSHFLAEFQFLNESVFLVEMNGSVSLCVQFVSNTTLDKTVLISLSTVEGTASGMYIELGLGLPHGINWALIHHMELGLDPPHGIRP